MTNYQANGINTSYFRTEIAILQEDIDSQSPGIHKFKIPILSTEDTVGTVYTPMNNRANKNILKSTVAKTVFDNTIKTPVGEINITPNRENIIYSSDTIKKIETRIMDAKAELDAAIADFQEAIVSDADYAEAKLVDYEKAAIEFFNSIRKKIRI